MRAGSCIDEGRLDSHVAATAGSTSPLAGEVGFPRFAVQQIGFGNPGEGCPAGHRLAALTDAGRAREGRTAGSPTQPASAPGPTNAQRGTPLPSGLSVSAASRARSSVMAQDSFILKKSRISLIMRGSTGNPSNSAKNQGRSKFFSKVSFSAAVLLSNSADEFLSIPYVSAKGRAICSVNIRR